MSNIECVIRSAAKHEIPEFEDLIAAAYEQYRGVVTLPVFNAYLEDLSDVTSNLGDALALVAEHEGRIAGSALFYPDARDEGWGLPKGWAGFRKLAVHPNWRGYGLGRKIAEKCVELGRGIGAPTVAIHTASFMSAARGLYERIGFHRCPEYDVRASELFGIEAGSGDVTLISYRLDLGSRQQRRRSTLDRDILQRYVLPLQGDLADPASQEKTRPCFPDPGIESDEGLDAALHRELVDLAHTIGVSDAEALSAFLGAGGPHS